MYRFLENPRHSGGIERYLIDANVITPDEIDELRNNLIVPLDGEKRPFDWEEYGSLLIE